MGMYELKGILMTITTQMNTLNQVLEGLAEKWKQHAAGCDHCIGEGGDGLECRHPKPGDEDPFCYPSRCPLLK